MSERSYKGHMNGTTMANCNYQKETFSLNADISSFFFFVKQTNKKN